MSDVNPSRLNLERIINAYASSFDAGSLVLDAGNPSGTNSYYFQHCTYETADMAGNPTYKCDLSKIPVDASRFDGVLCTQVLEHVKEPELVLSELHRVMKSNGRLLLTAPFLYEEHLIPHDYFRYTRYGLKYLLERAGFKVTNFEWLEGYSCAVYYFLQKLEGELSKLNADDYFHGYTKEVRSLKEAFLERELKNPIYEIGFPKNYVFDCVKLSAA